MKLTRGILVIILGLTLKTSFAKIKSIIFDGDYASIEMYPYSARLKIERIHKSGERKYSLCGASILNQDILLTAAHCVSIENEKMTGIIVKAVVGHSNVTGIEKHVVSSIRIHENYGNLSNDIAVLKLENSLSFGKTVKKVAIMKSLSYYGPASIAGWGATAFDATMGAKVLQHVRGLEVWSREECLDWYEVWPEKRQMLPISTFCVGRKSHPKGMAMMGDSGSALVVRDYIQIGLVVGTITVPNNITDVVKKEYFATLHICTNVSFHYDWILETVMKLYCGNDNIH